MDTLPEFICAEVALQVDTNESFTRNVSQRTPVCLSFSVSVTDDVSEEDFPDFAGSQYCQFAIASGRTPQLVRAY